jgi:OOP family OmpA-OmpF porin
MLKAIVATLCLLHLPVATALEQKDSRGCQDHPAFTRMPGSWIHSCLEKDFDAHTFTTGKGKTVTVEGHTWQLRYYPQASAKSKPSELQILRNFENAVRGLGGTVVNAEKSRETLHLVKDGKELWVEVWAEFTGKYGLFIVEKQVMAQDVVANADAFAGNLKATGHAAVYGLLFDTGKAELKPESEKTLGEISKLLKADPVLKLHVVGHTDSVGSVEANLKLSQERAEAVLQALVRSQGIAADRLRPFGNGPFAPVASNDAEEGRSMNRRVELVKQ